MAQPYIIAIVSQKGGVGKTTVAVNLAIALTLAGKSTLLVDSDLANPCVGIQLGMQSANIGTTDILRGKVNLKDVVSIHAPSGLHVIPGIIKGEEIFLPSKFEMLAGLDQMLKSKYEYIIIDTSPGYITPQNMNLSKVLSEILLVTTPMMTSLASVTRSAHFLSKQNIKVNLVINRVKNARYEFSRDEIEDMFEAMALAMLPEEEIVQMSVSQHIPVYMSNPKSRFSVAIKNLARHYISRYGISNMEPEGPVQERRIRIIDYIKSLFRIS